MYNMVIPSGPYLEFEKEIVALEEKLQSLLNSPDIDSADIEGLRKKKDEKLRKAYKKLTPWNKVELARRPGRPTTLDYIENMFEDFVELHGDRTYGDDPSMVGGFAKFNGKTVMTIGQQRGKNTRDNVYRNFGMPHPEGYRKALRLMKMAEKFNRPIFCFVDTQGAFPGIGAEERGQAEAIAKNLREMAILTVPIIIIVIGEGASGGALGIGVGDTQMMMENSWYSVISPEGCAAILWGDRGKAQELAPNLKLTAVDLKELGLVDYVIEEPIGGAHWDPKLVYANLTNALTSEIQELEKYSAEDLVERRIEKYSQMGQFS
jgi:acetyl-CoA carboxylase carboxyl transferase subunit alpha